MQKQKHLTMQQKQKRINANYIDPFEASRRIRNNTSGGKECNFTSTYIFYLSMAIAGLRITKL